MGCAPCEKRAKLMAETSNNTPSENITLPPVSPQLAVQPVVVEKSEDTALVKLRYYGGGSTTKAGTGCRSCGGSGTKYTTITTETIAFVSEDSPNNYFKRTFTVGHDYWVTEKQAEYLLTLTYKSIAGQIVHKFGKID